MKTFQKPTAELTMVTPEMAKAFLDANAENQRRLNRARVEKLVLIIKSGRWSVDGSPIRISRGGKMLDGQHRCAAIVESGIPCMSFVVFGLDESSIETIDTGMSRSNAHVMHMKLGIGVGSQHASMATQIYMFENVTYTPGPIAASEVIEIYDRFEQDIVWALQTVSYKIEPGISAGGAPVLGALVYCRRLDPDKVEAFGSVFRSGSASNKKTPAMQLRSAVANQRDISRRGRWELSLKALRALEATFDGEDIGVLRAEQMTLRRINARIESRGA